MQLEQYINRFKKAAIYSPDTIYVMHDVNNSYYVNIALNTTFIVTYPDFMVMENYDNNKYYVAHIYMYYLISYDLYICTDFALKYIMYLGKDGQCYNSYIYESNIENFNIFFKKFCDIDFSSGELKFQNNSLIKMNKLYNILKNINELFIPYKLLIDLQ